MAFVAALWVITAIHLSRSAVNISGPSSPFFFLLLVLPFLFFPFLQLFFSFFSLPFSLFLLPHLFSSGSTSRVVLALSSGLRLPGREKSLRGRKNQTLLVRDGVVTPPLFLSFPPPLSVTGTSYKFRVVAVNVIGSSPPSAPSKAYTVEGGRTHERPVDGPYITYNEAINETTIILKWTVSDLQATGRQSSQSVSSEP